MENTTYAIRCTENGTVINTVIGIDNAKNLVLQYEAIDAKEGLLTPDFYEIVPMQYNYFYDGNAIRKSEFEVNVPENWKTEVKYGFYSSGYYSAYERF